MSACAALIQHLFSTRSALVQHTHSTLVQYSFSAYFIQSAYTKPSTTLLYIIDVILYNLYE